MNRMIEKHDLKQMLENDVITVVFTKKDGSERIMKCTLLPEYLPHQGATLLVEGANRKQNIDVLSVWDIEENGWRSFRLDSIKEIR